MAVTREGMYQVTELRPTVIQREPSNSVHHDDTAELSCADLKTHGKPGPTPWLSALPTVLSSWPTVSFAWLCSSACDRCSSWRRPHLSWVQVYLSALPTRPSLLPRFWLVLPRS